ncbi:MAG: Ig-like domain repeat protein [Clostridia bacterium]|nr:Ig-like domain repeat protein [Clostridia bacterium]
MEDTFIASTDFEEAFDYEKYSDDAGNTMHPYVSLRHPEVNKADLKKALQHADETVWTMNDVTIESITVLDEEVTSGIADVKYYIDNIQDVDKIDVEVAHTSTSVNITDDLAYDASLKQWNYTTPITISDEGMTILTLVIEDNAGLVKTNRYYFFIDKEAPVAKFNLVELNKNVKSDVSLFTVADVVTNRQQAINMEASTDNKVAGVTFVSELRAKDDAGDKVIITNDKKYQYRLLATKVGEVAKDTDGDGDNDVPADYTDVVVDKKGNDLSGWKVWTGETETPVIDKEFDGIVQVRVQDRAGNWSSIVSTTSDGKETIITDNTNPVIDVKEYALNSNADTSGNTADEIINGTATDILVHSGETEETKGEIENEVIHTTTGDEAPWINDSAVLEVKITDEDLVNAIRSSGLNKGQINVKAEFNAENENKKIKIWNKNGVDKKNIDDSFNLTEDYIFGTETDKDLTFYVEYEGTGVVDITVSVKDQADVNDADVFSSIYKTQLRVDKINPYIIYKGYDITDDAEKDLLKANNEKVDYEVRNMPWGPNSQVLEVVVKDDDITPVQSKTKNIKFNADKALDLYKFNGDKFTKVKTCGAGSNNIVLLGNCEELPNEKYEANVGYKFYLVYEGTGVAKVEFFADDSAKEPNVRDYPSIATAADAEPVLYDAMLRVDKINPEIKNVTLVQTSDDVNDSISLFTINKTDDVEVNTRKKMKVIFEIVDNNSANDVLDGANSEQSGVNIQDEYLDTDLIDVCGKYVVNDKEHLYENVDDPTYVTNGANDIAADPHIDFILIPAEIGVVDSKVGGKFLVELPVKTDNDSIKKWVDDSIAKWEEEKISVTWQNASWEDGGIVIPNEFQGAIVLRTIDRVGNIDYSKPITFVAESREAIIEFNPQAGFIYSQNNYGWSKRNNDYVEIRVKDNNETAVADAWIENVFIKVTDFEGNEMDAEFAYTLDGTTAVNVSKYNYKALADSGKYHVDYGYDVIDGKGLVETTIRDEEGYIHLGYVKVSESAKIEVTIFDKAKANDVEYTGNKTTATWITRFDRTAPIIGEFSLEKLDSDGYSLVLQADDAESGMAPAITDSEYNNYKAENIPNNIFGTETSYLYNVKNDVDEEVVRFNSGVFNQGQYELPGLQYALLEEGDTLEDIEPWEFEKDPNGQIDKVDAFDDNGYHRGKFGKTLVWHNYKDAMTKVVDGDFNGYIVVRAIDRAGNITVMGYAPTLDVTADDAWKNETQYINVKALDISGDTVNKVEYYGNNGLLYPEGAKRDITTEALSGEGAFVEVVEEGITKVIVRASKSYADEKAITLGESGLRNDIWEGNLILGNPTATGYEDWKYQITDVKIDKTAPTFNFELKGDTATEKDKKLTETDVAVGPITINIVDANDPTPNKDDDTMSHIASGIKTVDGMEIIEWCAIPEGSEEEIWKNYNEDGGEVDFANFTGTIKIRVTDNAGNVTEKSQRIKIDSALPIISILKSHNEKCSHEPVDVFVTVSESVEFSDVKKVEYTITHPVCVKEECTTEDCPLEDHRKETGSLPLTGGTISVDREGITTIKVTAYNKANVPSEPAETNVIIHYEDLAVPSLTTVEDKTIKSGDWIFDNTTTAITGVVNVKYPISDTLSDVDNSRMVYYSLNGSTWEKVVDNRITGLTAGANTIRLQARCENCICESDVVTYVVNYHNPEEMPNISVTYDDNESSNWQKEAAVVSIAANRGESPAEIQSISYELGSGSATLPKYYLGKDGGNIVIQEEGIWNIKKIIITMESGVEYIVVDEAPDFYNKLEVYVDQEPSGTTIAKIDRTAPKVEPGAFKLVDTEEKALTLFGMEDVKSDKQLKLEIDKNKISDNCTTEKSSLGYYYAVVPNGAAGYNWKSAENGDVIITEAFEGTVLFKVVDLANNETIVSQTVITEGNKPEVSLTYSMGWSTEAVAITVDVFDSGVTSGISDIHYVLKDKNGNILPGYDGYVIASEGVNNWAKLNTRGGQILINEEGEYQLEVTAIDNLGNESTMQTVDIKIDKTAPSYSGSVTLSLFNIHTINNWDDIHDGWTYNHPVSISGINDSISGIKDIKIKVTTESGVTNETTLNASQTGTSFSTDGKYDLTITDNAGNVRNISFVIDKDLENVINVVGVDEFGKVNVAVTDGDDMLTFYSMEDESDAVETKMHKTGVTDQLWDGRTGVRYIYGRDDAGKTTNKLHVIVAPSNNYEITLSSLMETESAATPNRYLNIDADGESVTIKKTAELFNTNINKNIFAGSIVEINEDGVYSITTND